MKKKLMMVAVLIGALSLGACVDNKESDSVVAVRTAKAAQLNSIAAMNNAEAEVRKAMAAFQQALADAEQMRNDVTKATLEMDIATAKAQAEANLEQAKANLETAKQQLITQLRLTDVATQGRIQNLLTEANTLLVGTDGINANRLTLITEKGNLVSLKTGLITAEMANKLTIIGHEQTKAKSQALITEYEKYSKSDLADAIKAAQDAEAKLEGLATVKRNKTQVATDASTAYSNALANITYSSAPGYEYKCIYLQTLFSKPMDPVTNAPLYWDQKYMPYEEVAYTNDNGTGGIVAKWGYTIYVPKIDVFKQDVTDASRELSIAKTSLAEVKKTLADEMEKDSYKDLVKEVTDAQKAFDEATTSGDKNTAKADLETAESNLKTAIEPFEKSVENWEETVMWRENNLKTAQVELENVTGDNAKAYDALVAAFAVARDNKAAADLESEKADYNWDIQNTLKTAFDNVISGLSDFETLITGEKTTIANADRDIANTTTMSEEQLIANKEKEIAYLENSISAKESMYQGYMDQIKALIEGSTAE